MQTIYLDVLLIESLYINYVLLRAAAKLTHTPLRMLRCLIAAAGGSLFSLMIFLPPLPILIQLLCKCAAAAITVLAAFGWQRHQFLRQCGCFFCASFLLAGLMLAVSELTDSGFSAWGNSYCYLHLSLFQLVLFTAIAYFTLHLWRILRNRHSGGDRYEIIVRLKEKTAIFPGLADTGNRLCDPFSGDPVIVCSADALSGLLGETPVESLCGYRLIPCATVTAQGLMPLFRPDEVVIRRLPDGTHRRTDAMIGIGGTQNSAIFHPDIIGCGRTF